MNVQSPFSPDYQPQFKLDKREKKPMGKVDQPPKYGRKTIAEAPSEKPHYWKTRADI